MEKSELRALKVLPLLTIICALSGLLFACGDGGLADGAGEGGASACDSCHGNPPVAPHPVVGECHLCHGGTVLADGTIDAAGGKHVNGTVDSEIASCDLCHGDPPAPPHPTDTNCTTCHPGTVLADGTIDNAGGKHANGTVDTVTMGCDACHGNPPEPPHPADTNCNTCHGMTVLADGTIDEAGGFHKNGDVDVSSPHPDGYAAPDQHGTDFNTGGPAGCTDCHGTDLAGGSSGTSCEQCHSGFRKDCTFCHGGTDNDTGAPPDSVLGETGTDVTGVGAHTAHLLAASAWHKPFACAECHKVPTDALDEGHIDGTAAHVWGNLAAADGAKPSWADGSCSGSYCHGAKSSGGTHTAPTWTTVDGTQSACGACHALPPTDGHPPMDDCGMCHGCVADDTPAIRAEGAQFHINGIVNMEGEGECPAE